MSAETAHPGNAAPGDTAGRVELIQAERLAEEGDLLGAIELLTRANRQHRDPSLEMRLVDLRHEAARSLDPGPGRSPWPPPYSDPFPGIVGSLPEVQGTDLDAEVLGGTVAHHGCLVVRGLFSRAQSDRTIDAIDSAAARRDGDLSGPAEAWYRPFEPLDEQQQGLRRTVASRGGTWLADSPSSTAQVLDELASVGVIDVIAEHLGERPFFSLQKSTLRRLPPVHHPTGWHQDGSFLGPEVRTMNVWVALSHCGQSYPSPGIQVVPKRVEEILATDGIGPVAISAERVRAVAGETPLIRPDFEPGDAMLFDEHFLHRTYLGRNMTEPRYAVECWFFAPSHASPDYLPFIA